MRLLAIFPLVLAIMACGIQAPPALPTVAAPSVNTEIHIDTLPTPTPALICGALSGAVAVRNDAGKVIRWIEAGWRVCAFPVEKGSNLERSGRLELVGGGTILAACLLGGVCR